MRVNNIKGFLNGMLSSASFGLIPLFALPIMQAGMGFESILFYRFVFACMALGGLLLLTKQSFRISFRDMGSLILLAAFYDIGAIFLFWGYKLMDSGVATTIHFMYPVITTLIMMVFFKEKKSFIRFLAVGLAVAGVFRLSTSDGTGRITTYGILVVLISSLGYALYLIAVNQLNIRRMKGLLLTFYVFMFGGIILFFYTTFTTGLQPITNWETIRNLLLLALIPTVVSNLALVQAVKSIGSTLTSVLGAMEPVTAVGVGILVFGERFTQSVAIGILLIISAVILIILHPQGANNELPSPSGKP